MTVLQVGANDGMTHDPVHKFIKRDQWTGVLLEPQKDVFERYLKPLYARNQGIHVVNAALGPTDGQEKIYKIGFCSDRWASGLTTFKREILENAFSSGHVARQAVKHGIAVPEDPAKRIVTETIQVISLSTLRSQFGLQHIDFLQIDAEGYDFEIIKLFGLKSLRPRLIAFEVTHLSDAECQKCFSYLQEASYEVKSYGANAIASDVRAWDDCSKPASKI